MSEPEFEFPDDVPPGVEEFVRGKSQVLLEAMQKIGLYAEGLGLVLHLGQEPLFVGQFTIGDVAFSDRVQDPEKDKAESQFKLMSLQAESDIFDQLRENLKQKQEEEGDDEDPVGV